MRFHNCPLPLIGARFNGTARGFRRGSTHLPERFQRTGKGKEIARQLSRRRCRHVVLPFAKDSGRYAEKMPEERQKNQAERRTEIEDLAKQLIVRPIQSVVREERKEIGRLFEGLQAALAAESDAGRQEFRSWFAQIESALEAIARELARRDEERGS